MELTGGMGNQTQAWAVLPRAGLKTWLMCLAFLAGGWPPVLLGAQTMGLASSLYLGSGADDLEQTMALRVLSQVEDRVLGEFFESGFIGFNIPGLVVDQEAAGAGLESRKENLQFINLANALRRGGASTGLVIQLHFAFDKDPVRARLIEARLNLMDLAQSKEDSLPRMTSRSCRLDEDGSLDGMLRVLKEMLSGRV